MKFALKTIAICALFAGASTGFCQNNPPLDVRNVVQLASTASVDVAQDWLTVTLGSTREGQDPSVVQAQLRQALELALNEAKKAAQQGAMEVHTGQFSLQPRYGRDGKISGWQGSTELVLEGKDFARIGATAGKVQSMTITSSGFSLSQEGRTKVEADVQAMAIERFKVKAGDIARGFGFSGYGLKEVSVNTSDMGQGPRPRMMALEAKSMVSDAPVPMEAGKTAVLVSVSGTIALK